MWFLWYFHFCVPYFVFEDRARPFWWCYLEGFSCKPPNSTRSSHSSRRSHRSSATSWRSCTIRSSTGLLLRVSTEYLCIAEILLLDLYVDRSYARCAVNHSSSCEICNFDHFLTTAYHFEISRVFFRNWWLTHTLSNDIVNVVSLYCSGLL